jgi:hypothetical protein
MALHHTMEVHMSNEAMSALIMLAKQIVLESEQNSTHRIPLDFVESAKAALALVPDAQCHGRQSHFPLMLTNRFL